MFDHRRLVGMLGTVIGLLVAGNSASGAVMGPPARVAGSVVTPRASSAASAGPHLAQSMVQAVPPVNTVFRPLLRQLKGLVIPVVLPAYLPRQVDGKLRLYATVGDRGTYAYRINLGYSADCYGATACRYGEIDGGPEVDTPTIFDYPRGRQVHLRNGALPLFYPYTCGASCGDSSLVFEVQGMVYVVTLKAGRLVELLAMANSAATAVAP